MRTQPGESAQAAAPLRPSDIVTAYGRTADNRWILAWNREITFGWIPSSALGCTAPFEDLRPTDPDILLTPQPTAERAAPTTPITGMATTTAVSVAAMTTATALPTVTETPAPPEALACVVASTSNLNLRNGPARTARLIGRLRPGAKFSATGRNAEGTWLYGATERGAFGWVIASAMRCEGDVRALPIVADGG